MNHKKIENKNTKESFQKKLETHILIDKYCKCGRLVHNVSATTESVVCWKCFMIALEKEFPTKVSEPQVPIESGFTAGWKFMKEFVHADGRVFHKGIEVPELKGTLPPTNLIELKEQRKKKKIEKLAKKENKLIKQFVKKKKIKAKKIKKGR